MKDLEFLSPYFEHRIKEYSSRIHLSNEVFNELANWMTDNYHDQRYQFKSIPDFTVKLSYLGPKNGAYLARAITKDDREYYLYSDYVFMTTLNAKLFHLPYWGMIIAFETDKLSTYNYHQIHTELVDLTRNIGSIRWSLWSILQMDAPNPATCWLQGEMYEAKINQLFGRVIGWAVEEICYFLGLKPPMTSIAFIGSGIIDSSAKKYLAEKYSADLLLNFNELNTNLDHLDLIIATDSTIKIDIEILKRYKPKALILYHHHILDEETIHYCRTKNINVLPSMIIKGIEELTLHFSPCDPDSHLLEHRWRNALQVLLLESRRYNGDIMAAAFARIITAFRSYLQI
jgi:hypothetical protein